MKALRWIFGLGCFVISLLPVVLILTVVFIIILFAHLNGGR